MTRRQVQNVIKALHFVDRHQVPAFIGDGHGYRAWTVFSRDPPAYFAQCSDEIADQIWAAIPEQVKQ